MMMSCQMDTEPASNDAWALVVNFYVDPGCAGGTEIRKRDSVGRIG